MGGKIVGKVRAFHWHQWLVVAIFIVSAGFTAFKTVHMARRAIFWQTHRDETIRGWMSVNYVAHSYRVPLYVLNRALGLPDKPAERRALRDVAKMQRRSLDEVIVVLQNAITHARPPYPEPSPFPPDPTPGKGRPP